MTEPIEKINGYHWMMFFICFLGTVFAGTVSTLMSVYLPVAAKDLLGNKNEAELNNISAYINSTFLFGAAFGGVTCGLISDKLGRKTAIILSVSLYSLFTLLTGLMLHWWQVVICRFFSGFGVGGIIVTGTTLIVEEWPSRTKAIFVGFLSIAFPIGIFSAGVIDYLVSSWRQAFLVGLIPLVLSFLSLWVLKESAKWKDEKKVVQNASRNYPESIFSVAHKKNLLTASIIFGSMLIGLWAIFLWIPTWIHGLVISGDGQKERGLSMMMLGMGGLTGGFFSGWLINAIGARKSMISCFVVCSLLSLLLFKTNNSFSPAIYAEIITLALAFGASQGVLSVYIPALFPVGIRGTATGFSFNTGRVLTATAVLFVGVLVNTLGGYSNSLFIFSLVFIIGLIATFFTKENK